MANEEKAQSMLNHFIAMRNEEKRKSTEQPSEFGTSLRLTGGTKRSSGRTASRMLDALLSDYENDIELDFGKDNERDCSGDAGKWNGAASHGVFDEQMRIMEDDFVDDKVEAELALIDVQQVYMQHDGAYPKSNKILVVLKGIEDVADSLRKLDLLIEKAGGTQHMQPANGKKLYIQQKKKLAAENSMWRKLPSERCLSLVDLCFVSNR
ncbi:hypothetical protein J5N97_013140 [Dioscorea zingiberensis]|uniref:Uncharacterized protein n=1 Tax=Dioscorea zingiberensis TaxID=325984 RepID=A0A9D5CQ94_9LILI|nr:hypothetical protein J5N97_013140 [Dioscorea zingiberensis]